MSVGPACAPYDFLFQQPNHSWRKQIQVNLDTQSFKIVAVHYIAGAKPPATPHCITHEICRPTLVDLPRQCQGCWHSRWLVFLANLVSVQFQRAANAIYALMVSVISVPVKDIEVLTRTPFRKAFRQLLQYGDLSIGWRCSPLAGLH